MKTKLLTSMFTAALLCAATPTFAQSDSDYYRGVSAYAQDDFTQAYKIWLPLAEKGDVRAQQFLGSLFRDGKGVTPSTAQARYWYSKAAAQGDIGSKEQLAKLGGSSAHTAAPLTSIYAAPKPIGTARTVQDAADAYNREDYAAAVSIWRVHAEAGNKFALHGMGTVYETGNGAEKSLSQALEYYQRAADAGNALSQVQIGYAYETGNGRPKSTAKAREWYQKAAAQHNVSGTTARLGSAKGTKFLATLNAGATNDSESKMNQAMAAYKRGDYAAAYRDWLTLANGGNSTAQMNIGVMYNAGQGVTKSEAEATNWFRKSAEAGDADGQHALGHQYEYGQGIAKSLEQAVYWYKKAAAQHNADSQTRLAILTSGSHSNLSAFQAMQAAQDAYAKKDYAKAKTLWETAAAANNPMAMHHIGNLYETGKGVSLDRDAAARWYQKAADLKLPEAYVRLGDLYYEGYEYEKSYEKALALYMKAAAQGMPEGMYNVGIAQIKLGNVSQGYEWLGKAAERNNPEALRHIGYAHEKGDGPYGEDVTGVIEQSYIKAKDYYTRLANLSSPDGMYRVGMLYRFGHGVTKSEDMAQHWFMKAARLGGISGKLHLSKSNTRIIESAEISVLQSEAASGNVNAQLELGHSYNLGLHGNKSPSLAKHWLEKAAKSGSDEAQFTLAGLAMDGTPAQRLEARATLVDIARRGALHPFNLEGSALYLRSKKFSEAEPLMEAVADMPDASSEFLMQTGIYFGNLYNTRAGNRNDIRDMQKQIKYLTRAAEQGHVDAQYFLGAAYDGPNMGWSGNYTQARKWYEKAAKKDHVLAASALASLYAKGKGGDKAQAKAIELYKQAASLGHENAESYAAAETYHKKIDDAAAEQQRQAAWAARAREARQAREQEEKKVQERAQQTYTYTQPKKKRRGGFGSWIAAMAIAGSNANYSSSGSSSSSSGYRSSSSSSSGCSSYCAYGGLNPHSREYHQRRAISNPVSYYQNRYD